MPTTEIAGLSKQLLESGIAIIAVVLLASLVAFACWVMWRMQRHFTDQADAAQKQWAAQTRERDLLFQAAIESQQRAGAEQMDRVVHTFGQQLREQADKFSRDLERVMSHIDQHTYAIQALTLQKRE